MISAAATLPAEITETLGRLDASLRQGNFDQQGLDAVLSAINALNPELVPAAEAGFRRHVYMPRWVAISRTRTPIPIRPSPIWILARRLLGVPLALARPELRSYEVVEDGSHDRETLARHPDLALIFLRHENGYVRQDALEAIPSAEVGPFMLASLFYRLNDWVMQVRASAAAAIDRVLPFTPDTTIVKSARFIAARSVEWERWRDHAGILDGALQRPGVIAGVVELAERSDAPGMVALLRYYLRHDTIDAHLPRLAKKARTPAIRAIATEALITSAAKWPVGWEYYWIDKYAGVRGRKRTYGTRALQHAPPVQPALMIAAADRAGTVRKIAADAIINGLADAETRQVVIDRLRNDPNRGVRERIDFAIRHPPAAN